MFLSFGFSRQDGIFVYPILISHSYSTENLLPHRTVVANAIFGLAASGVRASGFA
jgi:hypothetical protein